MDAVTCGKSAPTGTLNGTLNGVPMDATHACCKCGGGAIRDDYAVDGRCKFDYSVSGRVPSQGSFAFVGQGLLNLKSGSSIINSCSSKAGQPEDCKCIDSRLTLQVRNAIID